MRPSPTSSPLLNSLFILEVVLFSPVFGSIKFWNTRPAYLSNANASPDFCVRSATLPAVNFKSSEPAFADSFVLKSATFCWFLRAKYVSPPSLSSKSTRRRTAAIISGSNGVPSSAAAWMAAAT